MDLPDNPYAPPALDRPKKRIKRTSKRGVNAYENERRSVLLLVLLSVITLGIYPGVWFLRRRRFLDSLDSDAKLGALAAGPLVALILVLVVAFVVPAHNGVPELNGALNGGIGVLNIGAAFQVRKILSNDFARSGRMLQVSPILTFVLGFFYLQYKMNQAADIPVRKTKR